MIDIDGGVRYLGIVITVPTERSYPMTSTPQTTPDAQAALARANEMIDEATDLQNQGRYAEADRLLDIAADLVDTAERLEAEAVR